MKPQSNPVAGFYPWITCELCLKIRIVQISWTVKRWKSKCAVTLENVRLMALSMDRWIETLAPDLRLAIPAKKRWRTCCATRGGAKTTRVGGSRYSSFTSSYRFFFRSNLRALPIACLFKIAQF